MVELKEFFIDLFQYACIGALVIGFVYFYKRAVKAGNGTTVINNYYGKKK